MHLDQLGTVKLVQVQQRVEVDVQSSTVRGSAGAGEGEEVDRHAEILTDHDRDVLGQLPILLSVGSLPNLPQLSMRYRAHHHPCHLKGVGRSWVEYCWRSPPAR